MLFSEIEPKFKYSLVQYGSVLRHNWLAQRKLNTKDPDISTALLHRSEFIKDSHHIWNKYPSIIEISFIEEQLFILSLLNHCRRLGTFPVDEVVLPEFYIQNFKVNKNCMNFWLHGLKKLKRNSHTTVEAVLYIGLTQICNLLGTWWGSFFKNIINQKQDTYKKNIGRIVVLMVSVILNVYCSITQQLFDSIFKILRTFLKYNILS